MASVELRNVSYQYPGTQTPVIDNLSLSIDSGEAHALLGASGAGKTTLLNLLSGILVPTSGQILIGDREVSELDGYARKVAQVFQFPVLYDSLSVRGNIEFPLKNLKLPQDERAERLRYIADELELAPLLEVKPTQLSLYEKQLVAVAKALVRPDISMVLLDEPLTAVEPKIKWRLRQTLRRVKQDLGVTMLYVTHDQTEALTFAERVSVLTADGILQTDTPEHIYNEPQHEFVGHFIGSPGMNFVPVEMLGGIPSLGLDAALVETVGFRPEWAQINSGAQHLQGEVEAVRPTGVVDDHVHGLVKVRVSDDQLIVVRGTTDHAVGSSVGIELSRAVYFADQVRTGGFNATV